MTFLEGAATAVYGKVLDPTGVDDLAAEWSPGQRATFSQAFTGGAARAREAAALADDGEHDAAIELRHSVLGDAFPQPEPQTSAAALQALAGGSITAAGRVVRSQRATQTNRPGRAWRTR